MTKMNLLQMSLILGLTLLVCAGCSAPETLETTENTKAPAGAGTAEMAGTPDLTLCTEPRPKICTMDYNPVCGTLDNGGTRTFSNGCSACSDASVIGWVTGECPALP
jgi:hypothetical protein